jgi:hypothetical protein
MIFLDKIIRVPFERDASGISSWTLRLQRVIHKEDGKFGDYIEFALYWGDKDTPTHSALVTRDEFEKVFSDFGLSLKGKYDGA